MQKLTNHRYAILGLGLALLMLFLGWPKQGVVDPLRSGVTSPMTSQAITVPSVVPTHLSNKPVATLGMKSRVTGSRVVIKELTGARLNRFGRKYTVSMSGRATCKGEPCAASIDLYVETLHNSNLRKSVTATADGFFSVEIRLTETVQEGLDWKMVASAPDLSQLETSGHRILVDEDVVSIESNLAIK